MPGGRGDERAVSRHQRGAGRGANRGPPGPRGDAERRGALPRTSPGDGHGTLQRLETQRRSCAREESTASIGAPSGSRATPPAARGVLIHTAAVRAGALAGRRFILVAGACARPGIRGVTTMRFRSTLWVVLALAVAGPVQAETNSSLRVQLNIGNAPPPPVVIYQEAPPVVVVPRSAVYVVDDDDCEFDFFRYGVYWFIWNDGYWYRSRSYGGPFRVIDAGYVPVAIWNVPSRRWKHHPHGGPRALAMRKHGHDHYFVVREREGRGHRHDED